MSQKTPLKLLTPWLDTLAIAAWGLLLLKLWIFGQIYLLIHPNYILMTIVAGFVLLLISGLEARKIYQRQQYASSFDPNTQHVTLLNPKWGSSLMLITAILGLLISPRPFSSDTALHRGAADSNLGETRATPQSFRANARTEERSLVEWVRTLNIYPEPDAYTGQKAKVQGFVVYAPDLPEQVFLLTRFVITCCAADVYPVSLPIKFEGNRADYPADKWLEVEGEMITKDIKGKRSLTIQAAKLTKIPEPKNPYEY